MAYIRGRIMHDNLRSLKLIKQLCKTGKIKGLVVGVDARKALGCVNYNYMQAVLDKYRQSRVPTRDSSSRRILKVSYLSRVEAE